MVNGVVLRETAPAVTPAQIYSTGTIVGSDNAEIFFDKLLDYQQFNHLRNFWIGDRFINIESGPPAATQIGPDWWSADWYFDLPPGTDASGHTFFIRNRWTNQSLNVQDGVLGTTAQPGFWNASEWVFEPIDGANLYRIRNALVTDWCLNIQNGTLAASPVQPGWWSAYWSVER